MKSKSILFFVFCLIVFTGCKYEEGPDISFRSACDRVCGKWEVESLTVDGDDSLEVFKSQHNYCSVYEFADNGSEYYIVGFPCDSILSDGGNWQLGDGNTTLSFSLGKPYGPVGATTWQIIRLADDEMWLRTQYFNYKVYEIHFKGT